MHRGSLGLQKLGKGKPPSVADKVHKAAVEQKKARAQSIRDHVKPVVLEGLKKLLPQVRGCTLQLLPSRKQYTAFDHGACPGSRSRTWGGTFSQRQSFNRCIFVGMVPACFTRGTWLPTRFRCAPLDLQVVHLDVQVGQGGFLLFGRALPIMVLWVLCSDHLG